MHSRAAGSRFLAHLVLVHVLHVVCAQKVVRKPQLPSLDGTTAAARKNLSQLGTKNYNAHMPLHLRRATPDDVEALRELGIRTFLETFGHLYPATDLESYLPGAYSVERALRDLSDPRYAVWLLEDQAVAVGYALAGPCDLPHPAVRPGDGELKRLYLLASHRGGGEGSRLLHAALDWLAREGPRTLWIGVWSENHGAQRLYRRLGFERVGEYTFVVGETKDHELILRRG